MSALQWRDWSCSVRVVVADGRTSTSAPETAVADLVEGVVRSLMDDVARACSRFTDDSDVARVNRAAGRLVPVRRLTVDLVDVALDAARRTEGAVDPTVGRHLEAAGYDVDIDDLRSRGASIPRTSGRRRADWRAIRVQRSLGLLGVPDGLALDLGATAKAWTADEAARRVVEAVGLPALVAIGGDVAVAGGGQAWPVLVSEHEGADGEIVPIARGGLATSSTRGRRWSVPGGERHHVIDPRTGAPAAGAIRTASVLAASCVEANTLSTAALVWGGDAAGRVSDRAARWVTTEGRIVTTGSWPHRKGVAA